MKYLEPYRSCSLFGALRYFSNISGVVCLVNGPSGCTYFNRSSVLNMNGYFNAQGKVEIPKIYCTDFDEKDAVFGGEEKLYAASEEIIEKLSPTALFIFNCCVSEIIGENINDAAEMLSHKYSIPVVPVHSAGFKGDHRYGMRMACDLLMEYFMTEKVTTVEKKVNILGEFDYFNRAIIEARKMLDIAGITDISFIPGHCTIEELRNAPNACLNLITCQNASRHLAEMMKEKFDIPYLGTASDFYGIDNCSRIYTQIFDFFGCPKDSIKEMEDHARSQLPAFRKQLAGTSAFVIAGTRRALGYSEILKELGVKISLLFSECDGQYIRKDHFIKYSSNIMCNEYPDDLDKKVEELKPDFILSTLPELVAPQQSMRRPLADFSGFEGTVEMGRYLLNAKKFGYDTAYALISRKKGKG